MDTNIPGADYTIVLGGKVSLPAFIRNCLFCRGMLGMDRKGMTMRQHRSTSDVLLRLPAVKVQTGLGRTAIYKGMKDGRFPRQRKITARSTGWSADAIQKWIKARPALKEQTCKSRREDITPFDDPHFSGFGGRRRVSIK